LRGGGQYHTMPRVSSGSAPATAPLGAVAQQPASDPLPSALRRGRGPAALIVFVAVAAYLHVPLPADGDGAAYVLQAAGGSPFERSIHVGYLLPLWLWVHAGAALGIEAITAAHAAAIGVGLAVGALSVAVGRTLGRGGWLAPAILLASGWAWPGMLFAEVYAPLLAALLAAWWALARRRDGSAAVLLAWALLIHPGALGLVPAVLVLSGSEPRRALRVLLMALALGALLIAPLTPDWLHGGRGVLTLPAFELSPWQSLQRSWAALSRDAGLAAFPLLLGLILGGRRAWAGAALVALGAALSLDRYADNAAPLVVLGLLAPLAALAPRALWELSPRLRIPLAAATVAVLILSAGSAASRHDAYARGLQRDADALDCDHTPTDWGDRQRARLICAGR